MTPEQAVALILRHGWEPITLRGHRLFTPDQLKRLDAWALGMNLVRPA